MLIKINGEEIDVAEGSSIQDVIEETNAPYTPGSIVCLIKGKKELEKNIKAALDGLDKGFEEIKKKVEALCNKYPLFIIFFINRRFKRNKKNTLSA